MLTVNVNVNSRPEVFYKKGALKNFTKFTKKHLYRSLFLYKVARLRPEACNFIKKETPTQIFFHELCEVFKVARVINLKQDFTE